jgi:hypothetical protein
MSGGGQTATSYQTSGPPAYLQPYLRSGAAQAQAIYNSSAPQYYPGSTVAAASPATQAWRQAAAARGLNGSPVNAAAGGYLQGVLGGDYLRQGNPYQGALNQSIYDAVIPTVESQFSLGGRYGSPAMGSEMTRQIADAIAPSAYGNYQQERGNQQAAAGMAPSVAGADWQDLAGLQAAGESQDAYGQNLLNANIDKWNYNQNLPYNKLNQYMSLLLGGNWGTQGTSTQTTPRDGLGGFLGGLLGALL